VDALSEDGRDGITLIALIGSVFSPYYAWARRRGESEPRDHCALNVALYGADARRWTMTERGRPALHQTAERLDIGPSTVYWNGDALVIAVDEIAVPVPSRVRGQVRVYPAAITRRDFALDPAGRHRWWPIAPVARVEVAFERPALRWVGTGYFDMNSGSEPLEQGFNRWDWSRADLEGETAILYDTQARTGQETQLALRIDSKGGIDPFAAPPRTPLPTSRIWRIARGTRCEQGFLARIDRTLEDTPFYARSVVRTRLLTREVTAMHESLNLKRFASGWVQSLLPFRMPRVVW
jgi:carotenoid 1,2-hydratase